MHRSDELLYELTHHVRCMSVDQIARTFFSVANGRRIALQLVRSLQRAGLVEARTVMVHPPLRLCEPVHKHLHRSESPDFHALSHRVQSRWSLLPERTMVVSATFRAAEITGGPLPTRRSSRDTELAHDLTLAEIFLHHYWGRTEASWIPEDTLVAEGWPRTGVNIPDAIVRAPQSEIVLELAGRSYSARRLAEIHVAHQDRYYELW